MTSKVDIEHAGLHWIKFKSQDGMLKVQRVWACNAVGLTSILDRQQLF